MNTKRLRQKRVIIPTVVTATLVAIGATVWSATAEDTVQGSEADRIGAAAVSAAGGGTAIDVETSDDPGEAYEVEVRKDDGTEVDIALDQDLNVVGQEVDGRDDDVDGTDDDTAADADDRALSEQERTSVERAALDAVGEGTVEQVEASDDGDEAYEVEIRAGDGTEWEVALDADFQVLSKTVTD